MHLDEVFLTRKTTFSMDISKASIFCMIIEHDSVLLFSKGAISTLSNPNMPQSIVLAADWSTSHLRILPPKQNNFLRASPSALNWKSRGLQKSKASQSNGFQYFIAELDNEGENFSVEFYYLFPLRRARSLLTSTAADVIECVHEWGTLSNAPWCFQSSCSMSSAREKKLFLNKLKLIRRRTSSEWRLAQWRERYLWNIRKWRLVLDLYWLIFIRNQQLLWVD